MTNNDGTTTDLAYAEILWKSADTLRGQIDAAEYKHVVLGLLFLKYISDSFEARRDELKGELEAEGISAPQIENLLENRDEYIATLAEPPESGCTAGYRHADRRRHPRRRARQPEPQGQAAARLRPSRHRAGEDEGADRPDRRHRLQG